jgi:hypothetical protein
VSRLSRKLHGFMLFGAATPRDTQFVTHLSFVKNLFGIVPVVPRRRTDRPSSSRFTDSQDPMCLSDRAWRSAQNEMTEIERLNFSHLVRQVDSHIAATTP